MRCCLSPAHPYRVLRSGNLALHHRRIEPEYLEGNPAIRSIILIFFREKPALPKYPRPMR
jgi:hypothetical protein